MDGLVRLEGVGSGYGSQLTIRDITLAVHLGKFLSVIGPNGAGKTTLLNTISGQLPCRRGTITYEGHDVTAWSPDRRARAGIGRSFQTTHLFPNISAAENVILAVEARRGVRARSLFSHVPAPSGIRAMECLRQTGLADQAGKSARLLSHGDKRKLELAMLLALEPRLMLLDEPTAGMALHDVPTILALIAQLKQSGDYAMVMVEHKLDVVMTLSDQVAVLQQGELIARGDPQQVISDRAVQAAYLGGTRDGSAQA